MEQVIASIITSIISGCAVAIPTITATIKSNSAREILQNERLDAMNGKIDKLSEQVEKYNDFDKRLAILENMIFRKEGK